MEQAALWVDEEAAAAQQERQAAHRAAREAADDQAAPRLARMSCSACVRITTRIGGCAVGYR